MPRKLGKHAPLPHPKTLAFASFFRSPELPAPPPKRAWEYHPKLEQAGWGMYANDVKSSCTLASKAHIIMAATASAGNLVVPSESEIVGIYDSLSPDDSGLAMVTVYDYWLHNPIAGQKLLGWLQIDHKNLENFQLCINMFGACDVGIQLPRSAMEQLDRNQAWDVVGTDGGILGGHCVPYFGYGREGETCVTWGKAQPTGKPFFGKYCDEAYGLILEGWFDQTHHTPSGFDIDALWAAVKAMRV